jgi:hypothetical protein
MFLRPSLSPSGRFTLLLLAVAFAFLLLAIQRDLDVSSIYDEGSMLVGAMRVADGEIPHRDFFTLYGPAQFYVLASLFKLFSPSILCERLWDTFVRALAATFVFLIVDKWGARREAYFAYCASLIWLSFFASYGYPVFPALLFALISAFFLLHVLEGGRRAVMLLASGASVGLVALFRYDIGFVTFITETSVVGAYVLTQENTREKLVVLGRILLLYSLGFVAICLPVVVGYLICAPLADFLFDIVSYSNEYYVRMRSLPFPTWHELVGSPNQIAIYLPIVAWAATLVVLLHANVSRPTVPLEHTKSQSSNAHWMIILFGALSVAFYLKGAVRVSVLHMALSIIPALVLLAMVVKHRSKGDKTTAAIIWVCIFVAAVPTLNSARTVRSRVGQNIEFMRSSMWNATEEQTKVGSCLVPSGFERIACFKLDKDRIDAARFLREHTNDNEVFFSGLTRHDKILINDMMLYFVAKRQPATKWDLFAPGLQTTAAIQNEMVSELESKKPRFIVLESDWDDWKEPNDSAVSSGVVILDYYIQNYYDFAVNFGTVYVLQRRVISQEGKYSLGREVQ